MPDYDFTALSPYDFEVLCRDLLQKHLGLHLQSFKTGRDQGIDLRYAAAADNSLVVQCKHYARSSFSALRSHLQHEELPKVQALMPARYILTTSIGLAPANVDAIVALLAPFCRCAQDVYGRQDLNNLLGRFDDIEKKHYKLWLTSTPVLERVLHNAIYTQTEFEREEIHAKLKVFVEVESLTQAARILHDTHTCIISGIPGIGKTTLAQILLIRHLVDDWEVVAVRQNVTEALDRFSPNPNTRQIFWYDDFLGQVSLGDKLAKNEDRALVQLIVSIGKHANRRFILTTREYILRQAKQQYEVLARADIELHKHVLELCDYSRQDKARVLLNHLYFYGVPQEHLNALLADRMYLQIIDHRNYSPRIVEWLTRSQQISQCSPSEYPMRFMATLDNPITLWEHAFENQISGAARSLLLVLVSAGQEVVIDHLASVFADYHALCSRRYGIPASPEDFARALKQLEGTFVAIKKYEAATTVALHNPSITDFLVHYLRQRPQLVGDIIDSCMYHEQLYRLVTLLADGHLTSEGIEPLRPHSARIAAAAERTQDSAPMRLMATDAGHRLSGIYVRPTNVAHRLANTISVAGCLCEPGLEDFIQRRLRAYAKDAGVSEVNRRDLAHLLEAVEEHDWPEEGFAQAIVSCVRSYLLGRPEAWEEMCPVAAWVDNHRSDLPQEEFEAYTNALVEFIDEEVFALDTHNAEDIEEMQDDLEEAGRALGLDFGYQIDYLQECRDQLASAEEDYDPDMPSGSGTGEGSCESSIEAMFDSLRTLPPTS